jgi:hypothetical protein
MPPRGAAAAPAGGDPFAALPHALALAIFSRLTVEQRLRCIEVCRGWRATLNDHSAWMQLDLTRADGSECSEALLRAATSRAGGQLCSLRLACRHALQAALCAVTAGNAATLQALRVSLPDAAPWQRCSLQELQALLRAAPQLRTLEADVHCENAAEAHRVLRNEPPFGPLRVLQLNVSASTDAADSVFALAADLATHASLASISLHQAPLGMPAAMDAVVDAALARRLSSVKLSACRLSAASAPALARLLSGIELAELKLHCGFNQLLDAPAAVLLATALRANTSLTALTLTKIQLWRNEAAAAELMGALTAHPRLRLLDLSWNDPHAGGRGAAEASASLAALLLANAPALQTLIISQYRLGDKGWGPVVKALRHNTHLTKLNCNGNDMSLAFARNRLLPAVRANTSLRELVAFGCTPEREAVALVAARARNNAAGVITSRDGAGSADRHQ